MATHIKPLLSPENGTELCRVRDKGGVRGFKKECLKENLSKRDCTFLTCSRCHGILREACNSNSGEQFCLCCKKKEEKTHPNLQVRNTVLLLKSSCPIHNRGCNWVGNLGDCEKHLEVCGYVHETCKLGCGVVLSRDELRIHTKEICVQRIVVCEYCRENHKFCDLLTHHSMCNKISVPCELGCDKLVIRKNMTKHMDIECGKKEIDCPFVQYGCKVGVIKRKKINQHLEDKKYEHMAMKVNCLEETVVKQKQTITKLSEKIDTLAQLSEKVDTLARLSEKIDTLFDPEKYNLALWNVEGITYILERNIVHTFTSKEYIVCGLPMSLILTVSKNLTMKFRISNQRSMFPLNHRYGYFITRLVCHNDTRSTLVFKSRDYLIGQPTSLTDKMSMYTEGEIATIDRDRIAAKFIRNGGIELQISFERP